MYGLTMRWTISDAPAGTADALREYVRTEPAQRFSGMPGLHQKTWQVVDGGFFAGIYLWATAEARSAFLEQFRSGPSKVSQLLGHDPDVVEEWDVVAVVVGGEGPPV